LVPPSLSFRAVCQSCRRILRSLIALLLALSCSFQVLDCRRAIDLPHAFITADVLISFRFISACTAALHRPFHDIDSLSRPIHGRALPADVTSLLAHSRDDSQEARHSGVARGRLSSSVCAYRRRSRSTFSHFDAELVLGDKFISRRHHCFRSSRMSICRARR
jgi:hypothetical protein